MRRTRPDLAHLVGLGDAAAIRREIARAVPLYKGIETLTAKGDEFQWGGRTLYADGAFATADGRAHFAAVTLDRGPWTRRAHSSAPSPIADRRFWVSTRRGKQFDSMIQRAIDPLTGAARDHIFISRDDLARVGLHEGTRVRLRSECGTFHGYLRAAPIKPGNLEVHWPEGNSLLSSAAIDPDSLEPDYNALVELEPLV